MSSTAQSKLKYAVLVVTAAVLLQLLWGGLRVALYAEPAPVYPAAASLQPAALQEGGPLEAEIVDALVERPLFWSDRTAYTPPVAGLTGAAPTTTTGASGVIDKVKLLGVYIGSEPGVIVVVDGERRRLRLGESVEDWTFTMVNPDGAIFESDDDSRTLVLEHAGVATAVGANSAATERKQARKARKARQREK